MRKLNLSKTSLEELYIDQRLSLKRIASRFGCGSQTVANYLDKYGIQTRTLSEAGTKYRWKLPRTNLDKGIIIGLLLGEGAIYFTVSRRKNAREVQVNPRISISNTNLEIINFLKQTLGGSKVHITDKGGRPTHLKTVYTFTIQNQRAIVSLLEQIQSYMVGEQELCDLMIQFCKSRLQRSGRPYSLNELEIARKICQINKRRGSLTVERLDKLIKRHPKNLEA